MRQEANLNNLKVARFGGKYGTPDLCFPFTFFPLIVPTERNGGNY